jgi:large subunit ribosomal protein L31
MKKDIHPKTIMDAKVTDLSTGKTFTIPSTKDEIIVEVTSESHPFYTGQHRIVDTENLVKKFETKRKSADAGKVTKRREKRLKRSRSKATSTGGTQTFTLKDMLKQLK